MDHKILLKILDVYEIAATDEEYVRLYADYAPAQKSARIAGAITIKPAKRFRGLSVCFSGALSSAHEISYPI